MIGKLLDYRYQVIKVLATGGFGQTYIAQDTKRPGNPVCVVKHLKPANSEQKVFDTAKRLFHNEAETLEKLGNHDQIPRLLAYFDQNQEFYLVQEFIEGHPLSEELLAHQSWSESQVVQMLHEVLSILLFVHRQGVIHRDIKPDNIIRRTRDNQLVLVDFGAVKQLRVVAEHPEKALMLTPIVYHTGTVAIGTPGYMPTEQGHGKPRPNSDIYALGIIAIQTLTGMSPIDLPEDPQTGEILWQHLVPVSKELATVLTKMVHYHFKDRYQSVSEVLQAVESFSSRTAPPEYPPNPRFLAIQSPSPQSRQRTVALAPANPALPAPISVTKNADKVSGKPDILQLLILVGLASGAAIAAPTVVKNAQNVGSFLGSKDIPAEQNCTALVVGSNIRSEPSAIGSDTIMQTVNDQKKFEVTGKRTKRGWVQVKLESGRSGWAHDYAIKNNEEWSSCLRDKGIALRIVDDNALIAERPIPKPKPATTEASEKSSPKTSDNNATPVMQQARKKYESGDLPGAIALLKSVASPANGVKDGPEMIAEWQKDWKKAESLFNDTNTALAQGKWDKVAAYKDHPEKLPNIQYWRDKLEPLLKQAADNITKQPFAQPANPNTQNNHQQKHPSTDKHV
ncbi:MAG: serine/threonine protein kinase [Rhizonema sp. PD38]|nr:serine/threonine protein kinase [Rhizonema sp. PD38]